MAIVPRSGGLVRPAVNSSSSRSSQRIAKRRSFPGRDRTGRTSAALYDAGVQLGSRSTPGPTSTSSFASAERAPRLSVAQTVDVSEPDEVAVRYSQFDSLSPAGTLSGDLWCTP